MSDKNVKITDADFEQQVLNSDVPVLVDFWASWCGPCRAIAPVIDELADEYEGRINVRKLNVDENPETARKYHVRSIPTLVLFDKGEIKETRVGAHAKPVLENLLNQYLI